jgi:hypothetical protein
MSTARSTAFRVLSAALLCTAAAAPACQWVGPGVRGSGVSVTEARPTSEFERVAIRGSAEVDIEVRAGAATEVSVTLDDNLMESFGTTVSDGELELGFGSGSYSPRVGPSVRIVTASLAGIAIHGSGDVTARGVAADELTVSIHGSGDVAAEGRADRVRVRVHGSGDVELDGLAARKADVAIYGSGDVRVHASEALDTSIHGSGDVLYRGAPRVESTIAGSGAVRPR